MAGDTRTLVLNIHAETEVAREQLRALVGTLGTTATQVDAKLSDIEGKFTKVGKGVSVVTGLIGTAIGGLSIAGFVALGREALQFADDLESASKAAGVGVERYQTLRDGLRSLDVPVQKVDDLFKSLTDTLGSVQGGTAAKGVVAALDKMGISSGILSGEISTADQLLDAIAGSSGRFASKAEYTASVVDLVGKAVGVDLAAALADGGDALHKSEQNFRDAGNVIDEEYIRKLADANEAIDQFASNTSGRLAIWLAQVLTGFGVAADAIAGFEHRINTAGMSRGTKVTQLGIQSNETQTKIDEIRGARVMTPGTSKKLAELVAFKASLDAEIEQEIAAGHAEMAKLSANADGGITTVVTGTRKVKAAKKAKAAKEKAPFDFDAAFADMPKVGLAFEDADAGVDKLFGKLDRTGRTIEEMVSSSKAFGDTLEALKLPEFIDAEQEARIQDFGRSLSQNVGQALIYGQKLGPALVNSLKAAAAEAISSNLFKLLTGGGSGGGILGSLIGGVTGLFGGAYAGGGDPPVGKWSLVGEKGIELIKPRSPITVVPNHMLGGGGGGGLTVNQSFAISLAGNAATKEDAAMFAAIARDQAIGAYKQIFNSGIPTP